MFGRLALVLLVPILVALGATTLLRASAAAPLEGAARSARRRSVAATVTTGLAGLAALVVWPVSGSGLDLRMATRPLLAALVVVLTSAVELTWPCPSGDLRVASLGARRGRSSRRAAAPVLDRRHHHSRVPGGGRPHRCTRRPLPRARMGCWRRRTRP